MVEPEADLEMVAAVAAGHHAPAQRESGRSRLAPETYSTQEVADLLGVSDWTLYQAVRDGTAPIQPIRVGRRIVWARSAVDQLLGLLDNDAGRLR